MGEHDACQSYKYEYEKMRSRYLSCFEKIISWRVVVEMIFLKEEEVLLAFMVTTSELLHAREHYVSEFLIFLLI